MVFAKQSDEAKVKPRSRKRAKGKNGQKLEMHDKRICSTFCSECQGTGIIIDGDDREKPTVPLSEVLYYLELSFLYLNFHHLYYFFKLSAFFLARFFLARFFFFSIANCFLCSFDSRYSIIRSNFVMLAKLG